MSLFIIAFCFASSLWAQSATKTNQVRSDVKFEDVRQTMRGWSVVGYVNTSTANAWKINQATVDAKGDTTFGFGAISVDGALGFQGGLTVNVAEQFAADVAYRWVNLTGNNGLNRIDIDGLLFQGRYVF